MSPSVGNCSALEDTIEDDDSVLVTSVTCLPEGAATVSGTFTGALGLTALLTGAFVLGGADDFCTGGSETDLLFIP